MFGMVYLVFVNENQILEYFTGIFYSVFTIHYSVLQQKSIDRDRSRTQGLSFNVRALYH